MSIFVNYILKVETFCHARMDIKKVDTKNTDVFLDEMKKKYSKK